MKKLLVLIGFLLICLVSNPVSASIIDVGSHVSTYTGKTRGFWFTAPADFIRTGLGLPTDASSENFDVSVLHFNGVPQQWPVETSDFDTLFLSRDNVGSNLLSTDIHIFSGDMIGILGSRGANSTNSYGTNYLTDILGFDVTLNRLLMQDDLRSYDPVTIGVSSSAIHTIGRVLMDTESPMHTPEPTTILLFGIGLLGLAGVNRKKQ
jgi:hypothetical protein